jgi:hypothetical protein
MERRPFTAIRNTQYLEERKDKLLAYFLLNARTELSGFLIQLIRGQALTCVSSYTTDLILLLSIY